jgi:imidazolonepropionase-like amidohydrolase
MRRLLAALPMLFVMACVATDVVPSARPHILAITNVTVIDVTASTTGAARLTDQTVLVNGRQITFVGNSRSIRIPAGAQSVNGKGRFLVPGLWDSHTHLATFGESALPLFVSQGVTSVRHMGGSPPS